MIYRILNREPDARIPEDVRELDRLLSSVQFEPRASLGPELLGRLRREGNLPAAQGHGLRQALNLGLVVLLMSIAVFVLWTTLTGVTKGQTLDQCCFDLDGGGPADDGVLVEAGRGEAVRRLTIYEDRDGSGGFSEGDLLRFVRGAVPVVQAPLDPQLIAFHQCCRDYDGGGKADDGVLVLGVPPDRIVMAGIYDTRKSGDSPVPRGRIRPALR